MDYIEEVHDGMHLLGSGNAILASLPPFRVLNEDSLKAGWEAIPRLMHQRDCHLLWLDLYSLDYLASGGFSCLIKLHKHMREIAGEMVICEPSPMIIEVLEITYIDRILKIQKEVFPRDPRWAEPFEWCFLEAIRREPLEMAHRWAYSDWLDEKEDARKDLVRMVSHFIEENKNSDFDNLRRYDLLTRPLPR